MVAAINCLLCYQELITSFPLCVNDSPSPLLKKNKNVIFVAPYIMSMWRALVIVTSHGLYKVYSWMFCFGWGLEKAWYLLKHLCVLQMWCIGRWNGGISWFDCFVCYFWNLANFRNWRMSDSFVISEVHLWLHKEHIICKSCRTLF